MAKPIRALQFHYPMIQFLINHLLLTFIIIYNRPSDVMRWCDFAHLASNRTQLHSLRKIAQFVKKC